jgi:arylsulfatase A-like enzyme
MVARARASIATGAALALAAGLAGCGKPAPPPSPQYVLAPNFHEAEIRSDGFDLGFLVASGAFRWPSWQDPAEEGGAPIVWSLTEDATLSLPVASAAPKLLTLRIRCHPSLAPRLPLSLALGAHPLAELVLTPNEQETQLTLPAEAQRVGATALSFRVPRRFVPPPGERDLKPAAVGITQLSVSRVGSVAARALPAREGDSLLLPPASSLGFFLRLGAGAQAVLRASAATPARLEGRLETSGRALDLPGTALEPGQGARVEWPLPVPAGSYARFEVRNPSDASVRLEAAGVVGLDAVGTRPLPSARLPERPSIVIYLTDTLRADRLSSYGFEKPTSPRLDALAREAIVFEDVWAQSSWTRPTVASLFTGLHPGTHGAVGFERPLAGRFTTLAELLKQAGYRTGAVVSNHVVHHRFGFAQGFDEWNEGEVKLYGLSAPEVVERGLRFVDRSPGPFLLYLHTMEPHATYEPTPEAFRRFAPGVARRPSRPIIMQPTVTPEEADYLDALYQGEVWDNDRALGDLLDGLRQRGRLDSTLFLFTSDHGEEFLDHGEKGHGQSLYRELIRVPLVVRLPTGERGGSREAAPLAQVDVLPTLLALLGIEAPPNEGRDLSALWLGRARPTGVPVFVGETRFGKAEKQALRVGDLKLVLNHDPRRYGLGGGPLEIYDVARDPDETRNLAGREWIAAGWMERRLRALLEGLRRSGARGPSEKVEITEEDREALRALGYVN